MRAMLWNELSPFGAACSWAGVMFVLRPLLSELNTASTAEFAVTEMPSSSLAAADLHKVHGGILGQVQENVVGFRLPAAAFGVHMIGTADAQALRLIAAVRVGRGHDVVPDGTCTICTLAPATGFPLSSTTRPVMPEVVSCA